MKPVPAIVEPGDLDAIRQRLIARFAGETAAQRRLRVGEALSDVRRMWPERGPKAKGWGAFLRSIGISEDSALRYIAAFREDWLCASSPVCSTDRVPRGPRVYFVQALDGGPIKIGTSNDVNKRVASLQTGSPMPLRLVGSLPGGRALEKEIHARLCAHRLRGEWFAESPEVIAAIKEVLQ